MSSKLLAAGMTFAVLGAWFGHDDSATVRAVAGNGKHVATYFGNQTCAQKCHDFPKFEDVPSKGHPVSFSRRTELHTWLEQDKHKDAMKVLREKRGQEIAQRLGIQGELTDGKKWNDKWDQCVSCHGVVLSKDAAIDPSFADHQDRIASGVSCVFCHGADDRWVTEHSKPVKNIWSGFTRQEKETKFGLVDLWDPGKRAELCMECHVGNAAKNKVVTHEMYAAGHPPLPSFELNAFAEAMPRHWETWPEKLKRLPDNKKLYEHAYGIPADAYEFEQVRMLAVSSVVAFRVSFELIHDLAQREAKAPNAKEPAWPELAAFDCYACHHELKSDSWRQLRVSSGRPGRPALRQWPMALLSAAFPDTATPNNDMLSVDFTRKMRDLQAALDKTPFGDAKTVAEKAEALVQWSKNQEQAAQAARYDRGATQRMLQTLFHRSGTELLDYDSARQLAWALQTLLPAADAKADQQERTKKHLGSLSTQLRLELPKGQKRIAEDFLPEVLKSMSAYDPREFQKTARALAAQLFPASK
jgi:Cytochrome c554 and c-prime